MIRIRLHRVMFFVLLCSAFAAGSAQLTRAQESNQSTRAAASRDDDTNLDTQLYLIFATNRDVEDAKMPLTLEPVMKSLRESLGFKHYNLAGSFLNRVKNNGRLDVSWVGGPFLVPSSSTGNPSFNQFTALVTLADDVSGRSIVRMKDFRFGSRVPVVTAQVTSTSASTNATSFPVVTYEPIGLRTDISLREGSPVVAGTLNVGPSGDAIIVVITARRSAN